MFNKKNIVSAILLALVLGIILLNFIPAFTSFPKEYGGIIALILLIILVAVRNKYK